MNCARFVCPFVLFAITTVLAQTNPVPLVNQPLVPTATAPGGASFTLTVNGTGFVSDSVIDWNGTALTTTFISSSQLTATVPASNIATASTASITVSSPSPGGGTSNVVFFAVSAPTNLQFTSFPSYPGADLIAPPIAADFNRDGKLDFAVVNYVDDSAFLLVFLGNGDGTFQAPKGPYPGLNWFVVGDFNGDGILDFAGTICDTQDCTLSILLGNGDGTFSSAKTIYTFQTYGLPPLVAGDFNGDGKLDVAIAYFGGIYVFLGNGDGTFQTPLVSNVGAVDLEGGVGDFNGDGKLDLIEVSGASGTQLAWLQGNGDGTFQTPSTDYSVGPDTGTIIAADLNGDSKLDLLTVQGAPTNTFTVMLGNGDGTFQAGVAYPVGNDLRDGVIGDFNAEGKLDLVLSDDTGFANGANTYVLLGNGDGTFQSSLALPTGSYESVAGDFNDDGKLDLVLATENGLAYLLQDVPQASFSPSTLTFASQMVGTTSSPQNVILTNSGTGPLIISSIAILGANSGDFSQTNKCPASVPVGANCQINITFTPTALGARDASLSVTDNVPGSPQSVPLSGTGAQPVVQFSPSSVNFGSQTVGGTTSPQSVTLTNAGGSPLTINSIGIAGGNAGDFADTSTCDKTLVYGASCQIKVTFTPTASGARNAALSVSDNAPGSPQAAALSGTGQDFSLAPSGSATATVAPGQTATYTVVVTPGGGFNQSVDLSCSGAPAQSTCAVSSSVTLDGVNPSMATVSVVTNGSAMGLTQSDSAPPINGMFGLWLGASWILGLWMLAGFNGVGLRRRQQRFCALGFVCVLAMGLTMSACGGGGGSSGGGGTQAGTYTLTVTGTSSAAKLTNETNLTLVVQ
ncbi:MAG TPA: FG-GAP-like repeat-containing protein [Terriglobales bacterium]|nr:FG-GAP-like repeat-containing protein [Terriglobales bacterium]